MTSSLARLNKARTFVLWALAVVWLAEMVLWGLRPLSEKWMRFWELNAPEDPQLATGLDLTHAFEAAAKGALGVLAVYALRSRTPFVRSALFVPMALVPPLNLAFQFRAQGFPLRPTLIAATLSVVVWETFFLFKDREAPARTEPATARSALSPWDALQYVWFISNAIVLTLASALLLFAPDTGLRLVFPCFSGLLDADHAAPSGLTLAGMAVGVHLTAVATATWIATIYARRNVIVRQAVAASNTLLAALVCALPLSQFALAAGRSCATTSLLIYSVPLLAGWLTYAALSHRAALPGRVRLARSTNL